MYKNLIPLFILFIILSLSCNKEENTCIESIDPACGCTQQYDPVCGCNGKIYGNACMAECYGISEYTSGECD